MVETGKIGIFNPQKEIAREVTLQVLIRHRDAMQQAREGVLPNMTPEESLELSENQRKINRVKGLYKVISAQQEMITISRPVVNYRCYVQWKKRNPEEAKRLEKPFETEDNDYNKLRLFKDILRQAELDIINAEQTTSTKDDYLIEKTTVTGKKMILTQKYFDMINGLEDTYEKIYLIMLKHQIVSSGIEEDEEKTYRELEKEAIERVREA